ncbi:hypothetical protein BCR37DRAFT_377491 [Protomyces lactucae-debilis]|uniref:Uncharacterized protein n=1 Tax=Protomyces lactucae-debilis TaxID=2754530 RepID=A0A1Y2FP35_PROLT|nr:uncharacterized protein BCR37DRAFT_377491 [Protomyces lactucae-debilis]ORY85772.1 hypothetical protein BCR37DRAFT_377491 [Protomyces lactucae-debilis]
MMVVHRHAICHCRSRREILTASSITSNSFVPRSLHSSLARVSLKMDIPRASASPQTTQWTDCESSFSSSHTRFANLRSHLRQPDARAHRHPWRGAAMLLFINFVFPLLVLVAAYGASAYVSDL